MDGQLRGYSSRNGIVRANSMDIGKSLDIEPINILIYEKIKKNSRRIFYQRQDN